MVEQEQSNHQTQILLKIWVPLNLLHIYTSLYKEIDTDTVTTRIGKLK